MGLIMCTSKYGAIRGVMSKFDDIAVSPQTDAKLSSCKSSHIDVFLWCTRWFHC
jgi:hypothetical protein